jgi:poly(3-hydroxybutyrate) depolymerase
MTPTSPSRLPSATCPPTLARQVDSGLELWATAVEGLTDYWVGALERRAMPWDTARDGARWLRAMVDRREPTWSTPHEVRLEGPVARLRDFSGGTRRRVLPTLVLPPQAGHSSSIVDYSERQSQIRTIRAAGLERVFSLDWVGATRETRDAGIEDYLDFIERSVELIGGPVNLVGDCQGGWLAAIYAALRPECVHTLTIAGAPIDFHAGDAVIHDYVEQLSPAEDMSFYRNVVALGNGLMPGEFMLNGFILIKPENELSKQLQLLSHLGEQDHVDRYRAFEDWFKHTQDIPGAFYLWIVEHLFRDNALVRGQLEIDGEVVDLSRIECPLYLLGGAADHITPPDQVFALADHAGTPAANVTRRVSSGGHLGLFMGSEALRDHWPPLMAEVFAASSGAAPRRATPTRTAGQRSRARARRRTPPARPPIPAP